MSVLLGAFGAERTETSCIRAIAGCIVRGGEIASHPHWFPGSLSASSWGPWGPVFSCGLNQWKCVSVGLSVCCQLIEQLTFSTRDSFRLGNEKTASRTHSLTSVACGEVEYLVCEMRREPREHGEGSSSAPGLFGMTLGSRFQAS